MQAFTLQPELVAPSMKYFHYNQSFKLENGQELPDLTIAYHTWGTLNAAKNNVVWVCHALTANSNAADWWQGVVGEGCVINPSTHFIVCANILGSCYGTTGPMSVNPQTDQPWYHEFPLMRPISQKAASAHKIPASAPDSVIAHGVPIPNIRAGIAMV